MLIAYDTEQQCLKSAPTFYYDSQKDFGYHSENLKSSEAEQLYDFLQSMITPNHNMYDLTSSSTKMYRSDSKGEEILTSFIQEKLAKKVKNVKLLDKIHYFKNQVCLEIKPFQVEGDYIVDNKNLGKVKIQIELSFRFDQPNKYWKGINTSLEDPDFLGRITVLDAYKFFLKVNVYKELIR